MNKIFRIVWSQATQSWVVVSELTKAHKKQSSSNAQTQRSTVKFSGNFIKSSAIALSLLSGHSAYAALNNPGTGDGNGVAWGENSTGAGYAAVAIGRDANASAYQSVAIGKGAISSSNSAVALGQDSKATASGASALSVGATASGNNAVAISYKSNASGTRATAIGEESNASSEDGIALGYKTQATSGSAVAIGREVVSSGDSAVALGKGSKATGRGSLALATGANATGNDSYAIGWSSDASAESTMAFGHSSKAKKNYDIAFGRGAETRDQGVGHSIAIGYGASAASNRGGLDSNPNSTGTLNSAGGVAIGTGAYTGINRNNTAINSSVAVGAGAGAGYRGLGADGLPTGNGTDPDDNATVLVKAFGGTTSTLDYFKNTGNANANGFFSFQNVDINEATALGRNTRAIGDQSVAIGAQSIAGQGSIVIGGNDIQAYDGKKYFKAADPNSEAARSVNDFNAETTPGTGKNNQPITISAKYAELVGAGLDNSYRASYGQDGSTVIGMQAHSTTPLGVAIGTNSIVRKGAFGATAIGSGASVLANAEAAVAIGMGSEAQGNYAVAAGTAARAKESAVAVGYQANAVESSVAFGHEARSTKESDIAVGKGAVASGNQGAIAMGLGTNAQGDSSIMIGGANVESASKQSTSFEKATNQIISKDVTERINGKEVTRHYTFAGTTPTQGTIAQAFKELTARDMDVSTLNFADAKNKNGHASTSLGVHSLAKGDLATAIGASARADIIGSLALGTGAHATLQNAVAIGTGSTTELLGTRQLSVSYDSDGNIVEDGSKDVAYTFKWAGGINTSEGDVVSFGSSGAERQLKNVAAGRVAEDSTDAINGSQLNSITKKIAAGFNTSGNVVTDSSGVFTSKKANTDPEKKDYETAIRSEDKVQFQVGNNLKLDRNETESEIEVTDDFDKTKKVKKKIRKADFAYSLNPVLNNLTSAEFNGTGTNAPTTKLTNEGVTITPVTTGKKTVSLTENGLDNGGNAISNVAGNLPSTKNNDAAATDPSNATKSQDAPTLGNTANQVNPTNAATVSDVLNAGWNIQGDGKAVDFVKPYDTVNFVKGDGTSVAVESADGKTSTVKYSVNLGNGLDKDSNNNITVKAADKSLTVDTNGVKVNPADKSLEVTDAGLKVKAGDKTLTTDENGLKVNTGDIESVTTGDNPGTVKVKDGDTGKIATVDSVVNAVNSAAFTLKASANGGTRNTGSSVTETGESIKAGSTVEMIAGKNLDVKHDTSGKITFATVDNPSFSTVQVGGDQGPKLNKSDAGDLKVSGSNGTDPVKITNLQDGTISADSKDAINGSQFHKLANNKIKLAGQNGDATATETTDQTLDQKDGIKFTIKSSDGTLLDVAAAGDTITLTPKTATFTTTDGVPTATTTNGKLVTADEVVKALTEMGWKAIADKDGSGTVAGAAATLVKAGETVTFKAGDNLAIKQAGKEFIYSLNPVLSGLTSAEFKNQAGDKTVINSDGVTITPVTNGKQAVSLTNNGLDNGGNAITNVAGNLDGAKANTQAPMTNAAAPNTTNKDGDKYINPNNAATVGDVLNAGWNLQGNNAAKDFVAAYDTVNFVDGDGTTVSVENTDNKTSTIKYSVNLGDGLEKDATTNKIKAKAGDGVTVGADGIKVNTGKGLKIDTADGNKVAVNTDGTTITVDNDGKVKAVTGLTEAVTADNKTGTEKAGQVRPVAADKGQLATVDTVAQAVNSAKWIAKATNTGADIEDADKTNDSATTGEGVAAGDEVTFTAGKNLRVKREGKNFTFATDKNVSFDSVKVGADDKTANGKKPVNLTTEAAKDASNNDDVNKPTTALNISSGTGTDAKPTQLVGVGSVLNKTTINTTPTGTVPAGSTPTTEDLVNLNEAVNKNAAATVGDLQNMGWKVSSDKTTGADGAYLDVVKNANEVRFVGKNSAKVSGKTENGVRTITIDVPDVKTAELVSSKDGSVIAPSTDSKLQEALKAAKDELAAAATPEQKEAAENKVKAAETALNKALDDKGVATAKNVADMINKSGFTLKTSKAEGGEKDTASTGDEVINPGKAVEMVAGKNLTVKQEANGKVTYSLNPVLSGLTSAEFKNQAGDKTVINSDGVTITPVTNGKQAVSLTNNGLDNGGNAITNVAGNLDGAKANTQAPMTNAAAPNTTNKDGDKYINPNNAATVGDVLNAGWNLQGNNAAKDFVAAYDTVNFVDGDGTTVSVENTDNKTSTIKYSVNLGDGLEKDATTNKIKAKAGDGVTVGADGIKVNTGKGLKIDTADGNKVAVNTDGTTITVDNDGKVKAVTGLTEAVTADNKTGTEKAGQVRPVAADKGQLATVDTVAQAVNSAKWIAKATNTGADIEDADKTNDSATTGEGVAAGDEVTFTAGKNLRVKREGKNFTFATDKNVSFDSVKVGADDKTANGKKPVNLTTEAAKDASNNDDVNKPTTALNISSGTGTDAKPTQLVGVGSVLNKTTINTTPTGTVPAGSTPTTEDLVNLNEAVNKNAAATVGDLQNMGWKVSSDKTTGADGAYLDVVKNANEVRFVGEGTAVVSGKTDGDVRTITVKVDDQVSTNNAVTPVVYTKADGTKVYPTGKKDAAGNLIFNTKADGTGDDVPSTDVITSVNGPKGTKAPTTLSNVEGNLDGAKTNTTAPTTNHTGVDTKNPTANNYVNTHNAATVGDVLQAGWNLQNNGVARDFVKPYDTVNFVNGGNTVAVVTTNADKTASNVTFNVTGLPVATTVNTADGPVHLAKVGDNYYPVKGDGTPNIETNAEGNPTNGYVKADNGKYYPADNVTFTKNPDTGVITITPKPDAKPVTFGNTLTNPNVNNTDAAPNNSVTTPTSLGNVKNNLDNVNDGTEEITKPDGTVVPKKDDKANVTHGPITAEEAAKLANPKLANGKPNPEYIGNNAATVSDVLNAGFNVEGNGKAVDFVKPYDTVNFRDGGNTTVSVTTDDNLTTHVTYNVTGLPVANTITDNGKEIPVVKVGNTFYPANPDGTPNIVKDQAGNPTNGYVQANDGKVYPRDAVTITENPDGTTTVEPKAGKTPTTVNTNVVNPNVANTKDNPGNTVNTPTKVGNVTSGLDKYGDQVNGAVVPGSNDKNRGLVDLSKPANGEPKVSDNTAATVGDLRNMGWIVSSDKTTGDLAKDYSATVRNANEVKFIGKNGIQVSGKTDAEGVRTLTFEMEAGEVTPTEITKADGTKLVKVGDKVYKPEDIGTDGQPKQGKDPVGTIANDGKVYNNGDVTNGAPNNGANPIDGITVTPNNGSKFVTGNQVADAIEKSGFVVGKNNKALSASDFENKDEKVNPNDELRFADGDNTNVKLATKEVLDASGKVKTVTTVKVDVVDLPVKYTDVDGNIVKKGEDGKYYNPKDLEGKVYDPTTKEFKNSDGTALDKQPEAKNNIVSSLVNPNDAKDGKVGTPSTLTNIANGAKTFEPVAADGTKLVQVGDKFYPADKVENGVLKPGTDATADAKDPVKVANDGNWYLASQVEANGKPKENATPIADVPNNIGKSGLVDFSNSNPNNAATVGDLQNLGFVVSTSDNKYSDQVRNANKVDFKGGNGIEVTGKTTADGTREVTVSVKSGDVVSTNKEGKRGTITTPEGKVDVVKGDDNKWYKESDLGVDGKPKTGANAVDVTTNPVTINKGAGFVTGNQVGDAIEKSGWNVGLADSSKANEAFNDDSKALSADKLEKVNPDDNVRFADGKNTKVQAATMDEVNKDGKKITNTYVRFNVDLPISQISSEDKDGNKVAKAADGKWYPVKEGKPDTTKEALEPSNVRTSASMDPDGLGDKYISTTSRSREESLTPTQLGELTGKQEAAAKAAKEKIKDLLKGQSKDVIEAASKAAENAAKEEAKVQYLKDKGLDKGTGGTVISNVAWGTKPSDAVNVDQLQNSGINVHSRTVEGSTGKVISGNTSPTKVKMDETVNVDAGNNIEITRNGRDIAIATSMNPQFDSVQFGKEGPKITGKAAQPAKPATATSPATPAQPAELSVNGAKIADVAPGRISATSTDAINGSQLHAVASNLNNKINKVGKRADAGTASALAAATIPQAYTPGKSLVGIAAGNYQGQNGLAVGMSRISDNGKIIIRLSGTANTQGKTGVAAGVGYQW